MVYANGASQISKSFLNFSNTSNVTVAVAAGTGTFAGNANIQFDLATTAVTAGQYGSTSSYYIPQITVDKTGRVTAAANSTAVLPLSGGTMSGSINMNNQQVINPQLVGHVERANVTYTGSGVGFSGNYLLNLASNTVHSINLAGSSTVTFINAPASGNAVTFTLVVRQSPAGSATITWANSSAIYWSDSVTPVLTTTAGKTDVFTFMTYNGGITFLASQVMANLAVPQGSV